ncbi:phosphatidate cytidylyltransferase, partial [Micrococcus endophyticus]
MTTAVSTPAPPRGGRDLKSAVLVGVGLLVLALVGLVWLDWLLVLLVVALL